MEKIRFTIRITKEMNEKLKEKSRKDLTSKNALINQILKKELKEIYCKEN